MNDDPELRTLIVELDALEARRERSRAFAVSILPHLKIAGAEADLTPAPGQSAYDMFDPHDIPATPFDVVATILNDMGIPAAKGGRWTKNGVRRVMLIDVDHETSTRLKRLEMGAAVVRALVPLDPSAKEEADAWTHAFQRAERRHNASVEAARKIADDVRNALRRSRDDEEKGFDPLKGAVPMFMPKRKQSWAKFLRSMKVSKG